MAARRGRGEGSIFFNAKLDTWTGVVSLGVEGGVRRRKTVYGATKAIVREKLDEIRTSISTGAVEPSKASFASFLDRWLEDAVKPNVRLLTYICYSDVVRLYVKPHLGTVAMGKLTPVHVQNALGALERAGKSPRVQQLTYAVCRMAFKQAIEWRVLDTSPLPVRAPKYRRAVRKVWDLPDCARFLAAVKGTKNEALYVAAINTGMRQGELLGLQWADVDLETGVVDIKYTLTEARGKVIGLFAPKTEAGRRTIVLPKTVLALFRELRLKTPVGRSNVFGNESGGYLLKTNVSYEFHQISDGAGLPRIAFHDLRHVAASVMLSRGLDMKKLQAQLGHADYALTANTYTHVLESERGEAAARMDGAFGSGDGV